MMASPKKIIVVVGATGNQGSSVARTFLDIAEWHVRCLTRNPSSATSKELATLGAEIVQADLSDPTSLSQAFANANAIFVNTDFWSQYIAAKKAAAVQGIGESKTIDEIAFDTEVSHGKNAAHAAAAVPSLERLVYSALPGLKKLSKGKYSSYHADSKGAVVDYILEEELELAKKTSFIYIGAYNTNAFISPKLDPSSGRYKLVLPFAKTVKMPVIDPKNSTGYFVRALIEDEKASTSLLAYDSYPSFGDVVEQWSKASRKDADYVQVTTDYMHQALGIPKQNLGVLDAMNEFGYMGPLEFVEPSQLKKQVRTESFEDWLNKRDWDVVLDVNSAKPTLSSMKEV